MAVTFDKIAYPEIEQGLLKIIDNEFRNVYISPTFKMMGNECIRIHLATSTSETLATNFEIRSYDVIVRYYLMGSIEDERTNEAIKRNVDRLRKHLIDNQVSTTYNWAKLEIESIDYNVEDEENEETDNLNIVEFSVDIQHYNQF